MKNILVVGPAWVGDMVMAQTLLTLLKEKQECNIDVIAPDWSKALLERMPEVRKGLSLPIGHRELKLGERIKLGKALRPENYDQAILCPNSIKSALVPFWAKIPIRTGWLGEYRYGLLNDIRKLDKKVYPLMVQRLMALALPKQEILNNHEHIRPNLVVNATEVEKAVKKFDLQPKEKSVLALCPGAEFGPAKRWPDGYYAAVANEKLQQGWQVWLFGSPNDKEISSLINKAANNRCHDLTGKTSLAEVIDLLSLADRVVSNDSGLMHISAALNRKLVVIYGSSSPRFTPPLNDQKKVVQLDLKCSPCFQRQCKLGHLNCLNQLEPKLVLEAMEEL